LAPRYAPTPYDDLLAKLPDRDSAARLGAAYLSTHKGFNERTVAARLRQRLTNKPLAGALDADLSAARLAEAHGWVLPETLAALCAIAARAA
jgi:hypothetical protein